VIALIVGTTAELIKVAPVYHELVSRGRTCEIWYTAQHVAELESTLDDLDLPAPTEWLVDGGPSHNLSRPAQVPAWVAGVARTVWRRRRDLRRRLRSDGRAPIVLVHGDTFTAPLGALVGRLLGARVGHVEAGMRSGSLVHPFPEELNRRLVAHFVDLHFTPTHEQAENLRRRRGAVVTTGANTVVDAVRFALAKGVGEGIELPERFGIATLHRFELVRNESLYRRSLEVIREHATAEVPIIYYCGASERERLESYGLLGLFDDQAFRLAEKLSYVRFLPVLARAQFVVTDSGGLQEESAHFGIPCAVHREKTERPAGEGVQMVLTRFSSKVLAAFLEDPEKYRTPATLDDFHPSQVIVDILERVDG
jgi:UDP-N-acetylglucosamine 2-epimerase (non-hydrolysing)